MYTEEQRKRSVETTKTMLRIIEDDFPYEDDISDLVYKIESDYSVSKDVAVGVLRDYVIGYSKMCLSDLTRDTDED